MKRIVVKYIKRFKPILIFIVLTLVGLGFRYYDKDGFIWKLYLDIGAASTVALAVLAYLGYLEYIESEDPIGIYFQIDEEEIDTGLTVLRKNCTRGEVLGIIGMFNSDPNKRFVVEDLQKNKNILKTFDAIQTGKSTKLIIKIKDDEKEQFSTLTS